MENKINSLEENKDKLNSKDFEEQIKKLNDELSTKLNELSNKKRIEKKKILVADSDFRYTHCDQCKENCDYKCDCWFGKVGRCKIYPWFGNDCEECGHSKKVHKQENYYYKYVEEEVSENTNNQQNDIRNEKR